MTKYPVQYPTACIPQAWSTGTPLLLLRTMLGLDPVSENLVVDAACRRALAAWSYWTSPVVGERLTLSGAGGSTPAGVLALADRFI
jgi:hypothetical protein